MINQSQSNDVRITFVTFVTVFKSEKKRLVVVVFCFCDHFVREELWTKPYWTILLADFYSKDTGGHFL